jgi:hypothetical protein
MSGSLASSCQLLATSPLFQHLIVIFGFIVLGSRSLEAAIARPDYSASMGSAMPYSFSLR